MFEDHVFLHPDSPQKLGAFAQRASQREHELLLQIQREANRDVRWGPLVGLACQILLSLLKSMFSSTTPSWMADNLAKKLLPAEKTLLIKGFRSSLMQEYLILLFMRKLLGAMKQEINSRLQKISPMGIEEEENLAVEIAEMELADVSDIFFLIQNGHFPYSSPPVLVPPSPEEYRTPGGNILRVIPGNTLACGCSCEHKAIGTKLLDDGTLGQVTECLRCGKTLSVTKSAAKNKKKEGPCPHSKAIWTPGKEGREAQCSECQAPIKDPGRFQWADVGLEPVGDDPSLDETINVDALFQGSGV